MSRNKIIIVVILLIISGFYYFTNNKKTQINYKNESIKIDLADFTVEELIKVPGIGLKKAEKIKEYAIEYGFIAIDDLKNINGIGEKTFENIKKYFYLSQIEYTLDSKKKININTATLEELIELPGIGEVSAKKILKYRSIEKIKSLEELKKIGISNSQINQIKGVVEF